MLALLLIGVLSFFSIRRLRSEGDWVTHTHEVLGHLDRAEMQTRAFNRANDPATVSELGVLRGSAMRQSTRGRSRSTSAACARTTACAG